MPATISAPKRVDPKTAARARKVLALAAGGGPAASFSPRGGLLKRRRSLEPHPEMQHLEAEAPADIAHASTNAPVGSDRAPNLEPERDNCGGKLSACEASVAAKDGPAEPQVTQLKAGDTVYILVGERQGAADVVMEALPDGTCELGDGQSYKLSDLKFGWS